MTDEPRDYGIGLKEVAARLRQPVRDLAELEQKLTSDGLSDDDVLAFHRARRELVEVLEGATLRALLRAQGEPSIETEMETEIETEDEFEIEFEDEWDPEGRQ